jgi:hypothetical protein
MPTVSEIGLAITIDVLMRGSLVLTAGLLLAHAARRNAALRHAILPIRPSNSPTSLYLGRFSYEQTISFDFQTPA